MDRVRRTNRLWVLSAAAAAGLAALGVATPTARADLYWDPGAVSGNGALDGGSGTWDLVTPNWATDTGALTNTTYTPTVAIFGGAIGGTVTLDNGGGTINAAGLQFLATTTTTPTYTIASATSGDTLTLTGAGGPVVVNQAARIDAVIGGTVGLTKSGSATLTLGAANAYTGTTIVSGGGTVAIGATNALPTATSLQFGTFTGTGTAAVSDTAVGGNLTLSGFDQTVASLYSYSKTATANTVTIGAGRTLTVSNAAGTGTLTAFGAYSAATSSAHATTFTGAGTFAVNTPAGVFQVGQGTLPTGLPAPTTLGSFTAIVTMSALTNFTANVADFRVGDYTSTQNPGQATLTLATNNTITATNFTMASGRYGSTASLGGVITVNLGSGTNTINATNLWVGGNAGATGVGLGTSRSQGNLKFNGANGTLAVRAKDGTGAANLFLGVVTGGSSTPRDNAVTLTGHTVDLKLASVIVGAQQAGSSLQTGVATSTLAFNLGSITATTFAIGNRTGANASVASGSMTGTTNMAGGSLTITGSGDTALTLGLNTGSSTNSTSAAFTYVTAGTLNVSGGTLSLPSGGITMGTSTATFTGTSTFTQTFGTSGAVNITGGSVSVGGNIVKGASSAVGTDTAALVLNGAAASLDLTGHRIGGTTAATALDTLTLQAGTLSNVLEINAGAPVTKSGAGTLTLAGTNTYTGATAVSAGTLLVNGSITSATTVAAGATVGGSGTISAALTVNGTLSPGNSPGVLTVTGDTTLASTATYVAELGGASPGTGAGSYDQTNVGGVLALGTATLSASFINGYVPASSADAFYILTQADGAAVPGQFAGLAEGATVSLGGGLTGQITYLANWTGTQAGSSLTGGNDVAIFNVSVPEPATAGLLAVAGVGLLARRRRARVTGR